MVQSMDQLSITQVTKCRWKNCSTYLTHHDLTWRDMTQLCCANITGLLKDLASLHGLILTRKARSIPGLNDFKIAVSPLDAFAPAKTKHRKRYCSMMPRTDLHDPWPCMCISTCSWQPSAHLTTTQQIQRTENLGLWWWGYMCAMTLSTQCSV